MATLQAPLAPIVQPTVAGGGSTLASGTTDSKVVYDLGNGLRSPLSPSGGLTAVVVQLELQGATWPASLVVVLEGSLSGRTYDTIATYSAAPTVDVIRDASGYQWLRLRVSTSNGSVDIMPFVTGIQSANPLEDATGLDATKTFYTAATSAGSPETLNTVTIENGKITAWTQV